MPRLAIFLTAHACEDVKAHAVEPQRNRLADAGRGAVTVTAPRFMA
jgi:hypothetical protein